MAHCCREDNLQRKSYENGKVQMILLAIAISIVNRLKCLKELSTRLLKHRKRYPIKYTNTRGLYNG
jgi:hypothetical protein